jgi:WD40 repeat protein
MVCFIDGEYLRSFNCLQELAYAFNENKPIVPVIMDQEAWGLLTNARGAEEVLSDPSCQLMQFAGKPIIEGQCFDEDVLRALYWQLSAINFCPCRDEDIGSMGTVEVVRNLRTYIAKDIPYLKEYAELDRYASSWAAKGQPHASLLHKDEAFKWKLWCKTAVAHERIPSPNTLQLEYVRASEYKQRRDRFMSSLCAAVFLLMLLAMASVAVVMWDRSNRQTDVALASSALAVERAAQLQDHRAFSTLLLELYSRSKPRPNSSIDLRSMTLAARVSGFLNMFDVVVPALAYALEYLSQLPYRFYDLGDAYAHSDTVRAVAFSHGPFPLASAGDDGTVILWGLHLPQGASVPEKAVPHVTLQCTGSPLLALTAFPDGSLLVAGTSVGDLCVWQAFPSPSNSSSNSSTYTHRELLTGGHDSQVTSLCLHPTRRYMLASAGHENWITLWAIGSLGGGEGEMVRKLTMGESGGQGPVRNTDRKGLSWSADGRYLAAAGFHSGALTLWDFQYGMPSQPLLSYATPLLYISALSFAPNGSVIAVVGGAAVIEEQETTHSAFDDTPHHRRPHPLLVFDVEEVIGALLPTHVRSNSSGAMGGHMLHGEAHFQQMDALAWDPTGCMLMSAGMEDSATVWHTDYSLTKAREGTEEAAEGMSLGSGAHYLLPGLKYIRMDPEIQIPVRQGAISYLAWSPDGKRVAAASDSIEVRVWEITGIVDMGNAVQRHEVWGCGVSDGRVEHVAWNSDGSWAVMSFDSGQVCLMHQLEGEGEGGSICDARGSHVRFETAVRDVTEGVQQIVWSPDETLIATTSDRAVRLWRIERSVSVGIELVVETRISLEGRPHKPSPLTSGARYLRRRHCCLLHRHFQCLQCYRYSPRHR